MNGKNVVALLVFALGVASLWALLHSYEVRVARARLVLDCVVALRTGESLPKALWDADDMNEAAMRWCDGFIERGGRPEKT